MKNIYVMNKSLLCAYLTMLLFIQVTTAQQERITNINIENAPAPLFRDPVYDGAADPVVLWNPLEKEWVMLYTQRRANLEAPYLAWAHGTRIGIATSKDGVSWLYRGTPEGLDFERGHNTYWMAEALFDNGLFHFWIVYKKGFSSTWAGDPRMMHYTSDNLWDWKFEGPANLNYMNVVENNIYKMPDGTWRTWYKTYRPEGGWGIYVSESNDLYTWVQRKGKAFEGHNNEGARVFYWNNNYWLITDEWRGIGVYRSKEGDKWARQPGLLLSMPGRRTDDNNYGGNPYTIVQDNRAFIIYHSHPGWLHKKVDFWEEADSYDERRSVIQIAEIEIKDGWLFINRDKYLK
jgi:hypothetical protein